MPIYSSMEDFLGELQAFAATDFSPSEVYRYLSETLIKPDSLETYMSFLPDRYTRNLV
ncbi:MAG: hypothetical protein O6948_12670 [Deltaproteobacteria bacterium]|nr:hypothetical protein [Deltaproteobacteria bacterium]